MSVIWLTKEELFPMVTAKLEKVDVVLDIGCGIMPQKYVRPLVHICCEPFEQYVEVLQNKIKEEYDRTYVIINGGWADAVRLFPPKSVDTVFLVDVIEHLEKGEALELLKATEGLARKQIALFTPIGFLPQHHPDGKDAWGLDGGEWQEHKSGWQPEDFDATWEIYASKEFHDTDSLGRSFEVPFGALWAIKTVDGSMTENFEVQSTRENIRDIIDTAVDIKLNSALKFIHLIMQVILKVKRSKLKVFFRKLLSPRK